MRVVCVFLTALCATASATAHVEKDSIASEANSLLHRLSESDHLDDSRELVGGPFCTASRCNNGGTCVDGDNRCACSKAYHGATCQFPWCTPTRCRNGGSCVPGDEVCTCPTGFTGRACRKLTCSAAEPCTYGQYSYVFATCEPNDPTKPTSSSTATIISSSLDTSDYTCGRAKFYSSDVTCERASCTGSSFYGGTIDCQHFFSCAESYFENAVVNCAHDYACVGATFAQGTTVTCSPYHSCHGTKSDHTITCTGDACDGICGNSSC